MTGCPSREQLRQLLAEQLRGPEATAIEAHVAACADCQGILDQLTARAPACRPCPPPPDDSAFLQQLQELPPWQQTIPCAVEVPGGLPALPGYEILAEVGRGGMGVVYKARQTTLNRLVAVKMIRQGELAQPDALARFRLEGELLARVQHPNVVQVHQVGVEQGHPFIIMEYVEGTSLQTWLRQHRPTSGQAAQLVETLAEAMQAAHERGIIHRDLKPGNVVLAAGQAFQPDLGEKPVRLESLTCKITDFGLAKNLTAPGQVTSTGAVVGTPSYMAPEQAQGDSARLSVRTDVYSLGAILYELLTGRAPFEGPTPLEILLQVVHVDPVALRRLQPSVPGDLETICLKCLAKEPNKRYASAADLAGDLRRWLTGEPIAARPVGRMERVVKWVQRRPVIAGLIAVIFMVMVAGTTISLHFALRAHQQEMETTRYAQSLEQKEKEAREALEAVEENLARGLLRPLGHSKSRIALNVFELDALEELAGLPRDRDRVRLLFIRRSLEQPGTAEQMGRRLEESVTAAIGLRPDLRQKVMRQAVTQLQDSRTPRPTKVVCARLLAQLRCDRDNGAASAGNTLLAEMAREDDLNTLRLLAADFARLPGDLPATTRKQAYELIRQSVDRAVRSTNPDVMLCVTDVFFAISRLLPDEQITRQATALAGRVVELAAETNNPDSARNLLKACVALASQLPGDQVATLGDWIILEVSWTTNPATAAALAEAFVALANRVPPRRAPALASRVIARCARTTEPSSLLALSRILAALAGKLPAEQVAANASPLGARIVELGGRSTNHQSLGVLAEALTILEGKLPAEQAVGHASTLAGRLVEFPDLKDNTYIPLTYSSTTQEVPGPTRHTSLPPLAGKLSADRLVELLGKTTDPYSVDVLSRALAAQAGTLPAEQAAGHTSTLTNRLVELDRAPTPKHLWAAPGPPPNATPQRALSGALVGLAGRLSAAEATRLASQLVELGNRTRNSHTLCTLAEVMCAVAGKLPAPQAEKHVAALAHRLVELAAATTASASLLSLSEALAALSAQLPAEQVLKHASTLADRIVKLSATATPDSLRLLSEALVAVTDKLSAEQAATHAFTLAGRIALLAERPPRPEHRRNLFVSLAVLADKLPALPADKRAADLADRIVNLAGGTTDAFELLSLSRALAALCRKLPAAMADSQALALADRILDQLAQEYESSGRVASPSLRALSDAFTVLPVHRHESQVNAWVLRMARLSHRARAADGGFGPLDRLLPRASSQTILEALKQPTCVGTTRSVLMKHLGQRYKRTFRDTWELFDYLTKHAPNLDLVSPLHSGKGVPTPTPGS
jgi:tRNA A-37 threonylcarbamoyl transferase component Bud32